MRGAMEEGGLLKNLCASDKGDHVCIKDRQYKTLMYSILLSLFLHSPPL